MIHYITTDYLREFSAIEQNVDDNKLLPAITKAHQIHLMQLIGSEMYKDLETKYTNNTLNADELTLVKDYIKPCVAQYSHYYALSYIHFNQTNKSINTESSEHSEPIDLQSLKYFRSDVLETAQFYANRLSDHIRLNYSKFPKYYDYGNPSSGNASYSASAGLWLGTNKNKCNKFKY
jgi:hypothetical protein